MMMSPLRLLSLLWLASLASAFAPTNRPAFAMTQTSSRLLDTPKPLEEVSSTMESTTTTEEEDIVGAAPKAVYKNLARGGQIEEVQWIDPAMEANTNPLEMSWWAYILFGFPFVLLANDALHFLPTDGPLAFVAGL